MRQNYEKNSKRDDKEGKKSFYEKISQGNGKPLKWKKEKSFE